MSRYSVAQGLATQRTQTVAAVVANLANPFYPYLLRSLHNAFGLAGYRVVLFTERTDVRAGREHLAQLLDRSLDGVLFTTATLDFDAVSCIAATCPTSCSSDRLRGWRPTLWSATTSRGAARSVSTSWRPAISGSGWSPARRTPRRRGTAR